MQNGENCAYILYHYCALANEGKVIGLDLSFMNRGTSFKSLDSNWSMIRRFLSMTLTITLET